MSIPNSDYVPFISFAVDTEREAMTLQRHIATLNPDADLALRTVVYFSPNFLIANLIPTAESSEGWEVIRGDPDDVATGWMAPGTIVKLYDPPTIWRLTGRVDLRTGYLEGRWPD